MEILFLLLYAPAFWLSWFLMDHGLKRMFKSRHQKIHSIIGFALFIPIVVVLMGLLAVTVLQFPAD